MEAEHEMPNQSDAVLLQSAQVARFAWYKTPPKKQLNRFQN